MRKVFMGSALSAVLLALCVSVAAQQQQKIAKIGWLASNSPTSSRPGFEAFRKALRNHSYVESKNITFEFRYAEDKYERLPALANELVRLKVDLIIAPNAVCALAAKSATNSIPIVFLGSPDPVAAGLVDSLARPGGNITGLTNIAVELAGKRLELLKETIPKLIRVALLWNPTDQSSRLGWKESQLPARELGLQLVSMEVSSSDKFEGAFSQATKAHSGALAVTSNPLATTHQKQIVAMALKNRLPSIFNREDFVDNGGLMSYGPDRDDPFRRAAIYVDKILKGATPADLPVEQPTKLEFIVNLKTATQIGLTIPPNVLARADRVIK
jgi:ABC-type uncharacterized transport system substrate-binding protein